MNKQITDLSFYCIFRKHYNFYGNGICLYQVYMQLRDLLLNKLEFWDFKIQDGNCQSIHGTIQKYRKKSNQKCFQEKPLES